MKPKQPVRMIEADAIYEEAKRIRDIAQAVMDACTNHTSIEAYARNSIASGDLAQKAAVLGIMYIQYEMEEQG